MVEAYVLLSIMVIRVAWDDGVTTALVRSATLKLVWSSSEEYYWLLVCVCVCVFIPYFQPPRNESQIIISSLSVCIHSVAPSQRTRSG